MTAILLLKRFWPALVGAALVVGVLLWGNHREAQGVRKERQAWEQEAARLRAVAAEEALQKWVNQEAANTAAAASRVALDALALETRKDADAYYRANPARNVPCLTDDRLRAIAQADAAASKATAAPK